MTAPVASGWSVGRVGLAPTGKRRLTTAHTQSGCLALERVEIRAKVVRHGRYVTFQMAEMVVPRELFRKILRLIDGLRPGDLVLHSAFDPEP